MAKIDLGPGMPPMLTGEGSSRGMKLEHMCQSACELIGRKPDSIFGFITRSNETAEKFIARVSKLAGRDVRKNVRVIISETADF